MATMQSSCEAEYFRVIHPLDDAPEQKCVSEGLGQIAMTSSAGSAYVVLTNQFGGTIPTCESTQLTTP